MAMTPKLRNSVIAAVGGGAIAIASALITGPTGNDGLEGVRYNPYQDVVGVWTVCYGHTGKDIMLGKKYTEAECRALLSKDLNTVARQIDPYIQKPIPETMRGALYSCCSLPNRRIRPVPCWRPGASPPRDSWSKARFARARAPCWPSSTGRSPTRLSMPP